MSDYATAVLDELEAAFIPRVEADVAYQHDPIGWMEIALGIDRKTLVWSENQGYATHVWDGSTDPLKLVCDTIAAGQDCGVESATGTGKTFLGAALALWFMACFKDAIVVTTAPVEKQLTLHLWKEIGQFWRRFRVRFPEADLVQLHARMKPNDAEKEKWAAVGYACGVDAGDASATRAQGFHAEHMLIITEETPGIDQAIMTALENTCTADHNVRLAFGNPDHQADALHLFATSPGVTHVRISALDHPNIVTGETLVPGAVGRKRVADRLALYGADGRLYQSRVRGISPKESAEALIKWEWCVAAAKRTGQPGMRLGSAALGVDVANSEDGDPAAISVWQGATMETVRAFPCPDPVKLAFTVRDDMRAYDVDPYRVGVDSVGVGAATTGRLKEMELHVRALNSGAAAIEQGEEKFNNLRSQMQWQMRLDLQQGVIAMPYDEELFRDLTTPTWKTVNGKIVVESKEDIKKRLGRSPNKGDATVYGNWVRDREPPFMPIKYRRPDETALIHADQREQVIEIDPEDSDSIYGDQLDQG